MFMACDEDCGVAPDTPKGEMLKRKPTKLPMLAAMDDPLPTGSVTWREIMFFVLKVGALVVGMTAVTWAAANYAYLWYR
jgi:hypothetical protein